ncbi:hypothetical protein D8B26_001318 [Coccidioides posadasii str. Silveira]|uniref:uncharacterized protein n=1 Tax=Coccidioides posadasii (strain RMSCC 757 / Silveira) TaxID=443226 RepID=UPI001BF0CD81|nr:hypothetical protein D8B26_001318 [Coccidioides posadasii str. Silveira]
MKFQYILNAAAFVSVALSANTPNSNVRPVNDPSGAVWTHKEHKSSDDHKYPVAPLMRIGGGRGVGWNSTTLLTKTHAQSLVTSTSGTAPLSAVVAITGSFVNSPGLIETGKPSATKTIKTPPSATDQGSRTRCVGTGKFKLNVRTLCSLQTKKISTATNIYTISLTIYLRTGLKTLPTPISRQYSVHIIIFPFLTDGRTVPLRHSRSHQFLIRMLVFLSPKGKIRLEEKLGQGFV